MHPSFSRTLINSRQHGASWKVDAAVSPLPVVDDHALSPSARYLAAAARAAGAGLGPGTEAGLRDSDDTRPESPTAELSLVQPAAVVTAAATTATTATAGHNSPTRRLTARPGRPARVTGGSPVRRSAQPAKCIGDRIVAAGNSDVYRLGSTEHKTPTKPKRKHPGAGDLDGQQRDDAPTIIQGYHGVLAAESGLAAYDPLKSSVLEYSADTPHSRRTRADISTRRNYGNFISEQSRARLQTPKTNKRYISKTPYKILDAPELQDDFYLNLVDWSSSNILGVGLGTCVYLWNAGTSKVTKLCDLGPNDAVTSVSWIPKSSHIAVGTNRGLVQLWDIQRVRKVRQFSGHLARVGSLAWNFDTLTSGSRDRIIYHHDIRAPTDHVIKLTSHRQEVCGLKWSPTENLLASGGNDNKLYVWDHRSTAPLHCFNDHNAAVKAIAWSPHERGRLVSGGGTADRHIRFWNTGTGTQLEKYDTGSQVCNIIWSKNSNELVSTHGYSQNHIAIWKYPAMTPTATLTGHLKRVLYLAMSPDGQHVVSGAGDETLRFWTIFNKPKQKLDAEANELHVR